MAEVVFQNLEEMLPQLEELEREGVFTHEELKVIIKRRTDFEYKMQKRVLDKHDILNYLEYEMRVDLLRKKRSKRLKLKPYNIASLGINHKIHALFRRALMKFQDDLKLWMQYIEFCKKTESVRAVGLAFGKLLQQHANNPDVWIMAAKHETEELNNIENARLLLQKGLRKNKESEKLWHEYFRLELIHVDKIKKRQKILLTGGLEVKDDEEKDPEMMDVFLLNKTAEIVFSNAIKEIDRDINFRLKFAAISQEFEETKQLQDLIYESLEADFPDDESMLEALCIRPLLQLKRRKDSIIKEDDVLKVENEAKQLFQEAVEKKSSTMWEKYLNCFSNLLKDSNNPQQVSRRLSTVLDIIDSSQKAKAMSESMYLFSSGLLIEMGKGSNALACLTMAIETYNNSASIWQTYLLLKLKTIDSWEKLVSEFQRCFSSLKDDKLLIWKLYIDSSLSVGIDETKLVFEEAVGSEKEVKDKFLPDYLNWTYEMIGISAARELYKRYLKSAVTKEFIQTCLAVESLQNPKSCKKIRFLHEKAIYEFGKHDVGVWLSYIAFEKDACDDFDQAGLIYTKAKKTLEGKLNSEFLTRYSLM